MLNPPQTDETKLAIFIEVSPPANSPNTLRVSMIKIISAPIRCFFSASYKEINRSDH